MKRPLIPLKNPLCLIGFYHFFLTIPLFSYPFLWINSSI
ncbi:hypothetical protein [Enterococcus phage vB_EfKS5]|nr:hypothetical protein [Enterococcus phage vB_EfKS5]